MTIPSSPGAYLKKTACTTAGSLLANAPGPGQVNAGTSPAQAKTIGIQVGAVSFVDEGVERVLDILQERGRVNTIFLTTFTYGRGLAGRQIPGQPFPDHGVRATDEAVFHGGNYARAHPRFYRDTVLKETRAPDHGDLDIVAAVLPAAKQRGLKVFCSCEDQWRSTVPGFNQVAEVDLQGRRGRHALPDESGRAPVLEGAGDRPVFVLQYRRDPVLQRAERAITQRDRLQPLPADRLGEHDLLLRASPQSGRKDHGIDFERVREGYRKLDAFVKGALADRRPSDGYFVAFWRLLVEYPEIIAWDKLFDVGKHQVLADVRAAVKAVNPRLEVGFHIEHVNSFNPIFRATRSYADLAGMADFLKVVVYNNCGGERYQQLHRECRSSPSSAMFRRKSFCGSTIICWATAMRRGLEALPAAGLSARLHRPRDQKGS